jgi:hypothetical protein
VAIYTLDRYHRAALMAEGAQVHADSEEEAIRKARALFWEKPYQNDGFKIVGVEAVDLPKSTET